MSGDFSINNIGGPKFTSTSRPAGTPPAGGQSYLNQNAGVDTFQRTNPLGTSNNQPLVIGGVPIKLDTSTFHSSTMNTLQNPPEHHSLFPPFTDVTG